MTRARYFAQIACLLHLLCPASSFALELLYNFEGDPADMAFDKLTGDGSQDGAVFQNVTTNDTFTPMFGTQSAFFDIPDPLPPGPRFSAFEIPDTALAANYSLTVAGFFQLDPALDPPLNRRVRAFTSFAGTGSTLDSVLLDFHTMNEHSPFGAVRGIVDANSVPASFLPTGVGVPGYHHYAMTVDQGNIKLYFDGEEVGSGMFVPTDTNPDYASPNNIFVGEDRGGTANESMLGNIDEVLVITRALSGADIAMLAGGATVSSVVTHTDPNERAVYYDFEGDSGMTITDKFTLDGSQDAIPYWNVNIDSNAANAKVGNNSVYLTAPTLPPTHSQLNVGPVGELGAQFTVSAVINALDGGQPSGNLARVLSTYQGSGGTAGRFILDFNPKNASPTGLGVRIILPNGVSLIAPDVPALNVNQTLTAVYDLGKLTLYLNGVEIATRTDDPAFITLGTFDLRIGEDIAGNSNEQFVGNMDDILFLERALTPQQVADLHAMGADALLPTLPALEVKGDYNGDGLITAADYVMWRNSLGETGAGLPADGSGNEVVDLGDRLLWYSNFGGTITSGSAAAVPEPSALVLVLGSLVGIATGFRSRLGGRA